jgi:hypothetical protein
MATLSARRAVVDELIAQHRGRIANTPAIACSPSSRACSTPLAALSSYKRLFKEQTKTSRKDAGCAFGSASMSATSWSRTTTSSAMEERSCSAGGIGQRWRNLRFAWRARSPAPSRRHGLRRRAGSVGHFCLACPTGSINSPARIHVIGPAVPQRCLPRPPHKAVVFADHGDDGNQHGCAQRLQ